ncbi:MAG TPA: helix-turn-helix domain-containing protein [Candidatus Acidoferrales bacterium]|nr:helix-turn-helix domain-containing protein [Candidatus Acidoferrales bacterium]
MSTNAMLSPAEAARLLKIGMTRIYALLYAGQIKAHKNADGTWSIPESAVAERIKERKSDRS